MNLSKTMMALENAFDALVTKHGANIKELTLINVSISTIFEAERLCKKLINKLQNLRVFQLDSCQPMLIDKVLHGLSDTKMVADRSNNELPLTSLTAFKIKGTNIEQVDTALTVFLK